MAPLLGRRVQQFHSRALNSVRLAIDHFNRPSDEGRREAVVHFALHSHEMLAKAILLHRKRRIQGRRDSKTISFATCLNLLDSSGEGALDDDDKTSLIALSNIRDTAQHSTIDLSEQELYLHVQTAVSIFDRLLHAGFDQKLADFVPTRVLPISTEPPMSLELLINKQADQIKELLRPGRRRTAEADAQLRALLAFDLAAAGEHRGPTPLEVDRASRRLRQGRPWQDVLPNVASLSLDVSGDGPTYSVRLTKHGDLPARYAETEDEAESAAIIRELNYFDKYNIKLTDFGGRIDVTQQQGYALIYALGLKEDTESYYVRRTSKGNVQFQGLSRRALERAREALKSGDVGIEQAVAMYRQRP